MTISEVIERLWSWHSPLDPARKTCDGVQYGDASQPCTGIAVTCNPSAEVIRQAAGRGCNLVLGHEPLFYDGWDETGWLETDRVLAAKKKLLDETGVVVVRDHDHMHNDRPDGIFGGLERRLGWQAYRREVENLPLGFFYVLPKTTVCAVANHVARVMNIPGIRILGDPELSVERVLIAAHFLGTDWDRIGIRNIEQTDAQLVIPGEVIDWTLCSYIQDSNALGIHRAVLNVGHYNLEEPGMKDFAGDLAARLGVEVPVRFLQSGDHFRWFDAEHAQC